MGASPSVPRYSHARSIAIEGIGCADDVVATEPLEDLPQKAPSEGRNLPRFCCCHGEIFLEAKKNVRVKFLRVNAGSTNTMASASAAKPPWTAPKPF